MSNDLKRFREDLHRIPETSFTEYKTQAYLQAQLEAMGYCPKTIIDTGLYVYIDNGNKSTIAFRSDIDALPVQEETGVEFQSKYDGYMHACGHDGHMSMLLGLAQYLADKKDALQYNVLLIFQPAEESIGGAKKIVESDLLKKCNVEMIFGIHLFPELPEHHIGCKAGPLMAMANEVTVTVHGTSAHGAMPHQGVDANIIMSKLLLDFQNIQTRMISPLEQTIITFGKFYGGTVRNQISDYAVMEGTIRSFNQSVQQSIFDYMHRFKTQYEALYGCTIEININDGYLPVINDALLYQRFKQAMSDFSFVEYDEPFMIAEDFSFYQRAVPGVFFFLGTRNESKDFTYSLHHSKFNFDSSVLSTGVQAYTTLLQKLGALDE